MKVGVHCLYLMSLKEKKEKKRRGRSTFRVLQIIRTSAD
jgi:hypothetical protein